MPIRHVWRICAVGWWQRGRFLPLHPKSRSGRSDLPSRGAGIRDRQPVLFQRGSERMRKREWQSAMRGCRRAGCLSTQCPDRPAGRY